MYLAVVLELFSRQVIGWAMSMRNNTVLVQNALTMAIWHRAEVKAVIVHSDQGCTYGYGDDHKQLETQHHHCRLGREVEWVVNKSKSLYQIKNK